MPHSNRAIERRRVERTKVDGHATILPAGYARLIVCDVIDLTGDGARIELGAAADQLRKPFDFSFDNFRTIRPSRLVWSNGYVAGIEFTSGVRK